MTDKFISKLQSKQKMLTKYPGPVQRQDKQAQDLHILGASKKNFGPNMLNTVKYVF
jgi:hypothetical protein